MILRYILKQQAFVLLLAMLISVSGYTAATSCNNAGGASGNTYSYFNFKNNTKNGPSGTGAVPIKFYIEAGSDHSGCSNDVLGLYYLSQHVYSSSTAITINPGEDLVDAIAESPTTNGLGIETKPDWGVVVWLDGHGDTCSFITYISWTDPATQEEYTQSYTSSWVGQAQSDPSGCAMSASVSGDDFQSE